MRSQINPNQGTAKNPADAVMGQLNDMRPDRCLEEQHSPPACAISIVVWPRQKD
jgi:hypothetical protein